MARGNSPSGSPPIPVGVPATIDPDTYSSLAAMLIEACRQHAARPAFECLRRAHELCRVGPRQPRFRGLPGRGGELPRRATASRSCCRTCSPIRSTFLGALRAGMIVVNVNPLYTPRELKGAACRFRCRPSSSSWRISPTSSRASSPTPKSATSWWRGSAISCRCSSAGRSISPIPTSRAPCRPGSFDTFTMLQDACDRAPSERYSGCAAESGDVALLQYTGGTTGVAERRDADAPQSGRQHAAMPVRGSAPASKSSTSAC